jgi:hypothetical protein
MEHFMFMLLRSRILAPCVGLSLGAALSAIALTFGVRETRQPSPLPIASIAQLTARLKPLGLRAVPLPGSDDPERGVLLTTTRKSSQALAAATWGDETEEGFKSWHGTLQVRHLTEWYGDPDEDVQPPGTAVWRWNRFLFFGDVELLEKVRLTLTEVDISAAPSS